MIRATLRRRGPGLAFWGWRSPRSAAWGHDSGRSLAALPAQEPVTRLGEWPGTGAQSGANPLASGLSNMFSGGSTPPRVATSTIGIRGLEAEDLARAQPNLNAVTRMEQLRLDLLELAMGDRLDAYTGKPAVPLSQQLASRR
jgi:hypothetical protein